MNFGEAIEAMKKGETVRRRLWVSSGSTVTGAWIVDETEEIDTFIAWGLTDGRWVPMTYSHTNVLAEDWEVIPV